MATEITLSDHDSSNLKVGNCVMHPAKICINKGMAAIHDRN